MRLKTLLRSAAALLAAFSLAGCLDIDQKVVVDKGELNYTAEVRMDAKLAALSAMNGKSGGLCGDMGEAGGESMKVEVNEAVVGGNVVCKLSAKGPIEKFATFAAGSKEAPLVNVSRASEGAWRIDSAFSMKEKAAANPMMDGMMEAMFAGRTLSWSVTVPKVLETNGQLSPDGKTVTWSVPLAQALKTRPAFYVIFKAERPWYSFITDLIGGIFNAIKNLLTSLFGGDKAPAPAAVPAAPAAAPAPMASAPAAEASTPAPAEPQAAAAPAPAPAPAPVETGPITASFDCAKASSAQERLICGDRELARLDTDLSAAYRKAREAAADPKALQAEQLQWLKSSRNACADKACLVEAYGRRLAQLAR